MLEDKLKSVVSTGTVVPSLNAFKDGAFHIGKTLATTATETEHTAVSARAGAAEQHRAVLPVNVMRRQKALLEEAKQVKEIAAATRRYISSQEVHGQMQASVGSVAGREC